MRKIPARFHPPRSDSPRGVALIEAMVALVIMAFGMLALVGLQGNMRRSADVAKQRGEALRLAQQEMERLRDFSVLQMPGHPAANTFAFADIATPEQDNANAGNTSSNATFTLALRVADASEPSLSGLQSPGAAPAHKRIGITVSWADRAGATDWIGLSSIIARVDPALAMAASQAPDSSPTRRPAGRNAAIPTAAKDLGDKTSAFVPGPTATVAWVFDNLTGAIVGRCTVAMGTLNESLSAADVAACSNNTFGYLLSGFVRFSFATPPDPGAPIGPALPDVDLGLVQAPATTASSRAPALPSFQCFDDAPVTAATLQTFVKYYCIVFPDTSATPQWSGRLEISGLNLGERGQKVCRYSADYDGDRVISNAEHPRNYYGVTGPLTRQNFLVINASASCPAGHGVDPDAGLFNNTATVLHQPDGV